MEVLAEERAEAHHQSSSILADGRSFFRGPEQIHSQFAQDRTEVDDWEKVRQQSLSKRREPESDGSIPIGVQLALFHQHYPTAWTDENYETSDKVIPVKYFRLLVYALTPVSAYHELHDAFAHAHGIAMTQAGDNNEVTLYAKKKWKVVTGAN